MLESRSLEKEMMDDLTMGGADMSRTLRELETINTLLGGYLVITNGLKAITGKKKSSKTWEVADLGCGGGDTLRRMARWFRKHGLKGRLEGIDANPYIIEYAEKHSYRYHEISYRVSDVFADEFANRQYDIITCSLFCHHFTDEELIRLFTQLRKQARAAVLVNDIHRNWFAFYSIKVLTGIFAKSPLIRNDAAVSVARAFRRSDLVNLMERSGIQQYRLKWMWAFRWQLIF